MVIGKGLISSVFSNYIDSEDILIFASGVSDSNETRISEFNRELELVRLSLIKYPTMLFVYFSTYSIDHICLNSRPYTKHKLNIENLIQENSSNYLICRLSNIVGAGGNSSNIFNYIVDGIKNEKPINVWANASRSILGLDELKSILTYIIDAEERNKVITIASGTSYKLPDLISRIEIHFGKVFTGTYLDKGGDSNININSIKKYLDLLDADFSINYIDNLLNKYYPCL